MTLNEIKTAAIPMLLTGVVSVISTFSITVNEVSANGAQGKKNADEIKVVQESLGVMREKQSAMDAKLDLLVERAKLGR